VLLLLGFVKDMSTRTNEKIKTDIETAKNITRQDVYEVLQNTPGETIAIKTPGVQVFLDSLPTQIKNEIKANGKTAEENILADLISYPL
jgi:hypothetical protein